MNTENKSEKKYPEIMQFVRSKGKMIPKLRKDGTAERNDDGKIVMIREKGLPRGIIIARKINGAVCIGWSFVNRKFDRFDKNIGLQIARGRIVNPSPVSKLPYQVAKEINNQFIRRCEDYFKPEASNY